jgi:hypothetical protein
MNKLFQSLALGALLATSPSCKSDAVGVAEAQRESCAGLLGKFDALQIPTEGDISCADSAADLIEKQQLADKMRDRECPLDSETVQKAMDFFRGKLTTVGCIPRR